MKNLANLNTDRMLNRNLAKAYPGNQKYQRDAEKAKRAVAAKEREMFCDIKE